MRHPGLDTELESLLAERGNALLATAVLLAGGRTAGEDLLQSGLERVLRNRRRITGELEGYLRRVLYHLAVDAWRGRRRRPELLLPGGAALETPVPDHVDELALRQALVQALARLPARQRAVLVLRYWEQLSEAETAQALGCSVGTVKSSASRGLVRLRELTADWAGPGPGLLDTSTGRHAR